MNSYCSSIGLTRSIISTLKPHSGTHPQGPPFHKRACTRRQRRTPCSCASGEPDGPWRFRSPCTCGCEGVIGGRGGGYVRVFEPLKHRKNQMDIKERNHLSGNIKCYESPRPKDDHLHCSFHRSWALFLGTWGHSKGSSEKNGFTMSGERGDGGTVIWSLLRRNGSSQEGDIHESMRDGKRLWINRNRLE